MQKDMFQKKNQKKYGSWKVDNIYTSCKKKISDIFFKIVIPFYIYLIWYSLAK